MYDVHVYDLHMYDVHVYDLKVPDVYVYVYAVHTVEPMPCTSMQE